MTAAAWVCLLSPLAAAVLITLGGTAWSRRAAGYLATLSTAVSFGAAVTCLLELTSRSGEERIVETTAYTWLKAGNLEVGLTLLVDPLSILMMLIVSGVGSLIVAYSIGYMDGDDEERRYFAYMALFVFSMLLLVQGGNFLLLLVGWGLVGLCSYLLIGYHHERPSAVAAAKKAFIMNAFGDATMALAFFVLIQRTGSLDFAAGFQWSAGEEGSWAMNLVALGLLGGAVAKSAQIPLAHVAARRDGGPDAGQRPHSRRDDGHSGCVPPRPLRSALRARAARSGSGCRARRRHAARRRADRARPGRHQARDRVLDDVADRLHVPRGRDRRLRERDVPPDDARVLQGAPLPGRRNRHPCARRRAGHAKDGRPQKTAAADVGRVPGRSRSPLRHPAPLRLLLQGRDPRVRPGRGAYGQILFAVGVFGAFLTGLYTFRMVFLVFGGEPSAYAREHLHKPDRTEPWIWMAVTVGALAVLAVIGGWLQIPGAWHPFADFLEPAVEPLFEPTGRQDAIASAIAVTAGLLGIWLAWWLYSAKKEQVPRVRALQTILEHKFYFDEAYDWVFYRPATLFARAFSSLIERPFIAGTLTGVAFTARRAGGEVAETQTGLVRMYAFVIATAVATLALVFVWVR